MKARKSEKSLVVGLDVGTSKISAAHAKGVKVISEAEYLAMLD